METTMEATLEPKIKQELSVELSSIEKFVREIEERPFLYLGSGYWYSRQTDCVYKRLNGKLEFVAQYSEKV